MADALGVDQQGVGQSDLTTDYLGAKVPVSFRGQPALPSTAGAAAGGGATPATIGGGKSPGGLLAPTKSGELGATTFQDLASALGSQGGAGGETASGPAVGGAGSFPASFDLANINLGNTGAVAPDSALAGVGGRLGPTGTLSFTTGNRAVDTVLGAIGRVTDIPMSQNLVSLAAQTFGGPVFGALAGITGPVGALLTVMQLTHAIASQFDSTLAGQINSVMHDETLTPQMQAQMLADLNAQGPTQGGPQAIANVTNVNASTQAGPASGSNQNLSLADSLSLTPTFADLAAALGLRAPTNRDEGPTAATADPAAASAAAAANDAAAGQAAVSAAMDEGAAATASDAAAAAGDTGGSSDAF